MPLRHLALVALFLSTAASAQRVSVMIELQSPPAIESYLNAASGKSASSALRAATQAARNEIAVVENEQQPVVRELATIDGANVLFTVQRLFNGIAVDVDASQLDAIAKLPGVKSVTPLEIAKPSNTSSVPLIGAPDVWKAVTNRATGKNVKVGVLDTGIDYLHRDFGGSGDYTNQSFTDNIVPFNAKVVGGTDFAGDNYDASSSDANKRKPVPDPDPMDCAGHGSHVASTLGGFGVLKDGSTYAGPYDSVDESKFLIGPGVAPEAKLYAVRIFGCSGSTGLITQALEWALDPNNDGDFSDRMDVVNMSLGSEFGSKSGSNVTAANNLARSGCVVVASAGNSGDTYYITGTPASGDWVLSAASSVDALESADGLKIDAPDPLAGVYVAHHSVNFDWLALSNPISGTVAYPPSQRSGCAVFNATNAAAMTGKIALLDWTDNDCGSAQRVLNANNAGAIGVILRYTKSVLDIAIAGSTSIPSTLVPIETGDRIIDNLSTGVTATLSADLLGTQQVITDADIDTLSSFSSRGPRIDDNAIKPEITAPGQSVFSVRALSGFRGTSLSGTSMAAPHVAGVMALLKQIHPDWPVDRLKALAMNTASHDLFTGQSRRGSRYGVGRIGAGRIDALAASRATAVALNAGEPGVVGLSFGAFEVSTTTSRDKDILVENRGSSPITYAISYDPVVGQPGVDFNFPKGNSITVPANGSATFQVRLFATASEMRHRRDASLTAQQNSVTRHWLPEASGYVTLSASGAETLRVPAMAIPRAVATMHTTERTLSATKTMTLHLAGDTVATGTNNLEDENAIVTAFELVEQDPPVQSPTTTPSPWLALQSVGIATDFAPGKKIADAIVYFAISTKGAWTSPQQTALRIDVDTNNDGTDDMRITLEDLATFTTSTASESDVFIAAVCSEAGLNCKRQFVNKIEASVADTVLFNTNVIVLPVRAGDLGLGDSFSKFTYRVRTGGTTPITLTAKHTYDVAAPGLSFSSPSPAPFGFADTAGNTIGITYDAAAYKKAASRGILLLHHHNATGIRDEVVTLVEAKHRAGGK